MLLVIRGGLLLDPDLDAPPQPADIAIEDGIIKEVSRGPLRLPDAAIIEAAGCVVMPGLIDCHVHVVAGDADLARNAARSNILVALGAVPVLQGMLSRGFTTVRDAGGATGALAEAVERGLIAGPRILPSGMALSQTGGHGDFRPRGDVLEPCSCAYRSGAIARVVDGVDAVRLATREELQKGATQIKIMASGGVASPVDPIANTQFSEAEIRAIVEEAQAANTYVMAHAYTARAIGRAVRCGVRTIEHGNLVDADTAALMATLGAGVVPTLVTYDALAEFGASSGLPAASMDKIDAVRTQGRQSLEIYRDAGVLMGYGSDLLGPMHAMQSQEFRIRAEVLGNRAAIRAATSDAARLIGQSGSIGSITPGARADILLLDGNPLDDIDVLSEGGRHIRQILSGGKICKSA